jgi:RNA polymerase sigma factor (sigma-70 family)
MAGADSESTVHLLARAREGDRDALDTLYARYLPRLRRWASGRLPGWARDVADTDDLVQETLVRSLRHMGTFQPEREGALHAYLRQAVLNRIRDEIRHRQAIPAPGVLDSGHPSQEPSPLQAAIGAEAVERYEAALAQLKEEDREAVIGRLELGLSFEELTEALGKPSVGATRKAVERAVARLAAEMARDG